MTEAVADQGRSCERHRAKQTFLPETRLERRGDRRQPREIAGQHVRLNQRIRRGPPAEHAGREEIEGDLVREEHPHEQVPGYRPSEDRARACRTTRPDLPQLRVMGKSPAGKALSGHEREAEQPCKKDKASQEQGELLSDESPCGERRVICHPQ